MQSITERQRYRPSGRAAWGTFLPWVLFTFALAVILAAVMSWLYSRGWYLIVLVPCIAAGLLLGPITIAITKGKCRIPAVAGLFGFLAGVFLYGSYLYFGMILLLGSEGITRFDLLPNYISLRLHTEIHHDLEHPSSSPDRPDPIMNGIMLAVEAGLVLFLTSSIALGRSRRAFCEKCDLWKQQHVVTFPPGYAKQVAQWLDQGQLAQLASLPRYVPKGRRKQSTMLAVECCNWSRSDTCPVYLAAKEVSTGGGLTAFDGAFGKVTIPRSILFPAEVADLAAVFPQLMMRPNAGSEKVTVGAAANARIEVQAIASGDANKVLNGRSKIIGNVLVLLILVVFWGSIAGIFGSLYESKIGEVLQHKPADIAITVAWLILAAFCLLFTALSGYVGLRNSGVPGNLYYRWLARRAIASRLTKWVDPSRPGDLPLHFVQVVPRKNWGTLMLETATDTGFLQIDPDGREIRFEGDVERYRIPCSAITSCEMASYSSSAGQSSIEYWVVVIQGTTAAGKWEAPISRRQTDWLVPVDHRRQWAQMIHDQITPLLSPDLFEAVEIDETYLPTEQIQPNDAVAVLPPSRTGWLRRHGLRLAITLFAIGFGIWRGISNNHTRVGKSTAVANEFTLARGGASRNKLRLTIDHIRRDQQLIETPPFTSNGGRWTTFDCAVVDDPDAKFTVAVETPAMAGHSSFSFARAAILPGDPKAGTRVLTDLAKALHCDIPAELSAQPLQVFKMPTAILGEQLASPDQGLKSNAGTWVATKWFIQNDGLDAEIFFDYDLSSGQAEFSEKDTSYDNDVLLGMADALRDGPRPVRTPQNDPSFTDIGPTVVDLQAIPGAADCSVSFARGNKLITLIGQKAPATVTGITLQNPQQPFMLARCDGFVTSVICVDPDGKQLVVAERMGTGISSFSPSDKQNIWFIDRTAGVKRQLTGPWGQHGWIAGDDTSISPDSRYLAVHAISGTMLDKKRTRLVYLVDLSTGLSVQIKIDNCHLKGWMKSGDHVRAIVAVGNEWEPNAGTRAQLIDPATGQATSETFPNGSPQNLSPDGKWSYTLQPKLSIDFLETSIGLKRSFTFNPDDRRSAEAESFHWLNSRFIEFDAAKPCFIDVSSLKLGYLPAGGTADEPTWFRFSPDFHWAITTQKGTTLLGRVVEPPLEKD